MPSVTGRPHVVAPVQPGAVAAPGAVEFVNAQNFQEKVLRARGPVAVEFMSFACGFCRKADPMIRDVAAGLANKVKVVKVNVPVDRELAERYRIRATPTLVMFQDGREVGRTNPELTPAGIRRAILAPFEGLS